MTLNDQGARPESVSFADSGEQGDPNARPYRMYYDKNGGPDDSNFQIRRFVGQLRMANVEELFGDLKELPQDGAGNRISGWKLVDGLLWSVVANPLTGTVNLLSIDVDGTYSAATDLNGDSIADVVDIYLADGRRFTFVTEELGREALHQWLLGENPLCEGNIVPELDIAPFGCDDGAADSGADGGWASSGAPLVEVGDTLCAGYSTSGRPYRLPVFGQRGPGYGRYSQTDGWIKRNEQGGLEAVVEVTVNRDADGNHVSTDKHIIFYDDDGNPSLQVIERVDHDGNGTRTTIKHNGDGTGTIDTEPITADLNEDGTYNSYEDTKPPLKSPNGSTTEPGPDDPGSDPSSMEEWCANYEPYVSGVERAAQTDPAAFQVTCEDLVSQSSENNDCVILEWASPEDFDGAVDPPSTTDGCGNFQQPGEDGSCEPTSVEERVRGLTAQVASADLSSIVVCPPIVCNPPLE